MIFREKGRAVPKCLDNRSGGVEILYSCWRMEGAIVLPQGNIQKIWSLDYPLNLKLLPGNVNKSFLCLNNNVVVKQYDSRFSEQNIINSLIVQDFFSSYGISAEVLYTRDGDIYYSDSKNYFSISRYVPGLTLDNTEIKRDTDRFNKFGAWLARCHKMLSAISFRLTEETNLISIQNTEDAKSKFEQLLQLNNSRLLARQAELFNNFVSDKSFEIPFHRNDVIHGDMRLNNIIYRISDGGLTLIDFDQVSFMNRTYEIMRFFLELENLDDVQVFINHLKIFIYAYENVYPISKDDKPYIFNLYFYNLLTNLKCFEDGFRVKNNTLFVQSRLMKIEWLNKYLDRINAELENYFF